MQTGEFLRFLKDSNITVFSLEDAVKVLRCKRAYAGLFLHRCSKKKLIGRVERGLYYLTERFNEYEIASRVLNPSYVSMVSALAYYGLTTQIPRVVYVVSTKRHRPLKNVAGFDFVFKRIKREAFFGFHKESDGNVFIADAEKAIVDIFYFNDVNDLDESALEKPSRIDINKLVSYAKKTGKKSVVLGVVKLLKESGYIKQAKKLAGFF